MSQEETALNLLSAELSKIYLENIGKEPDPQLVQEEAEALVEKYGPITTLKDIFAQEKRTRG